MLNKKRLAMMALAASMVLPTNLAYLSIATPISVFAATNTATELPDKTDGVITLVSDTDYNLSSTIEISDEVKLNLNGQKITSSASIGFKIVEGGSLTIEGTGSIESTTGTPIALTGAGTLIITGSESNPVKIETSAEKAAIGLGSGAKGSIVTLTNVEVKSPKFGLNINGGIEDDQANTKITLTKATVDGIYQAGATDTKIIDSTVSSDVNGIEIRAGKLNISGKSEISGSESGTLTVNSNTNGATTSGAGIAVARHTTNQTIDVTIEGDETKEPSENPNIKGVAALIVSDPEDLGVNGITIEVSNATLTGATYDVAYSSEIPFTLTDTTLTNNKLQKVEIAADGTVSKGTVGTDEEIPYTIINTPTLGIPNTTLKDLAQADENGEDVVKVTLSPQLTDTLPDSYADLPLEYFEEGNLTPETLGTALSKKSEEEIDINGESKAPKYTYTVTLDESAQLKASSEGIEVDGEPIVKIELTSNSTIKLVMPVEESSQIVPMAETGEGDDGEDGNTGDSSSGLYVAISELDSQSTDAIDTYLASKKAELDNKDYHVDSDAFTADIAQPLTISGTPEVTLDENGFIEVQLATGVASTGNTNNTGSSSRPSKPKPKPEEPTTPVVGTPTTMYRLYNKLTGEHLYTIDKNERDNLLTSDTWKDEGQGWIAPSVSDYPVYRLLNPNNSDHHYTTDKNEFDTLPTYGWVAEGVAFFSADKNNTENVILHRLYNPNAEGAGSHHYTADTNERDALVAQGWKYEGTAWAGLPANK